MVTATEIQHTRIKGELSFQNFVLKLIRRYWKDDYAQPHGRKGQSQHGVDITGHDYRNGYVNAAVQCKASETDDPRALSEKELIDEVNKAKSYTPKLDIFIVAYGGDRDANLQRKAQELSRANEAEGLFRVQVWSWEDITNRALDFPDVAQQLVLKNQVPTADLLDPRRPKASPLHEFHSTVQSAIARLEAATERESKNTDGDPALTGKLDLLRDQIRAGNGEQLVEQVRSLVTELSEDTHPHQKFRAYAILGSALAQVNKLESAAIAFDSASDAEPNTADSYLYKGRAAFLRGKKEVAYEEAKRAFSIERSPFAAILLLEAAPEDISPSALEVEVRDLAYEVEVAGSLSRKYADANFHEDAIRIAKQVTNQDWKKDSVVGQAILGQFEDNTELRIGAPMNAAQALQIDEARSHLERAWTHAKNRPDKNRWVFLAAHLSLAYRLLGLSDEAESLIMEAYKLDPIAPSIAQLATVVFVRRAAYPDAKKAMAQVVEESEDPEDFLLAGWAALSAKDWESVEVFAKRALEFATSDDSKASAAEMLVLQKFNSGSPSEAIPLANSLRKLFVSSISFEARIAEIARRLGDQAELDLARDRLAAFGSSNDLTPIGRFVLADAYADDNRWSEAADLLDGLHALNRPSEILIRRLFALYRADRTADARTLLESLLPSALQSPELLRIGAAIYERSGLLPKALGLLSTALDLSPNDLRSRIDWANLCIRDGKENQVRTWVKRAPTISDGEADDLMQLAQLFDRYGRRKDAMRIGYNTLQRFWGGSEALHMTYMSLFLLHSKGESFLHPISIQEDSVTFLENEYGGKATYKIETGAAPASNVLSPNHSFARQLLGKKKGDQVNLVQGIGQSVTWTIIEIKHKYLDLLHRSMEQHATLFPGSRNFGQFHINLDSKEAFEPVFESARKRAKSVEQAVKLYSTNAIPVDSLAKILGLDPIDASRGLRFNSGALLDTCIGANEERQIALKNLRGATKVLVDALTISLWDEIGLLALMPSFPIEIKVVQATVDALLMRVEHAKREMGQKGGSLEAHDGKFRLTELSEEYKTLQLKEAERILEWVRANAEIVPTEHVEHEEVVDLDKVISRSSLYTATTAAVTNTAAIFDDRRFRDLATYLGAHRVSWTQPLLILLLTQKQLSQGDYVDLIANLARNRIGFVTSNAHDLFVAAELGSDSPQFKSLVEVISREGVDPNSLVVVVVEFIIKVWNASIPNSRDQLFSAVFEAILTRPGAITLLAVIYTSVSKNLRRRRYPENLISGFWNDYVELFVVGHFIGHLFMKKGQ
jgi:tetratricopeptide (TPR) repeat protein